MADWQRYIVCMLYAVVCSVCAAETPTPHPDTPAVVVDPISPIPLVFDEAAVNAQAEKLAKAGATGVPDLLKSISGEKDAAKTAAVIRALILLKATDSVPALTQLVRTTDTPEVARECWVALGKLAGTNAVPTLLFVLNTPRDVKFRRLVAHVAAMKALAEIAAQDGGPAVFVGEFERIRPKASADAKLRMAELLEKMDTGGSRQLLYTFMSDTDTDVQRVALTAIRRADVPQIIGTIQAGMSSTEILVRKETLLALGRIRAVASIPTLIPHLDSKDPGTKTNAIWALLNITGLKFESAADARLWYEAQKAESPERFSALQDQMKNGAPPLLPLAIEEIGKIVLMRDRLETELKLYLNHADFRVRAAACDALGQVQPTTKLFSILIPKLRDTSDVVRSTAWRALQRSTGQSLPDNFDAWESWLQKRG